MFSLIYSFVWGGVTGGSNDAFVDAWEGVSCPFPDYVNGYNQTEITCAPFDHAEPYSTEQFVLWNATGAWYSGGSAWVAALPTGWAVYTGHLIASGFVRIGYSFVSLIALFVTPSITMYGQTVTASDVGWINGPILAFNVFGVVVIAKGWL